MQTIRAPKLIELLLNPPKKPVLRLVLSDEGLFRRLAQQSLARLGFGNPAVFAGKGAVLGAVTAASEGSLFAAAPPAIVELDAKLTAKQWEQEAKTLERMPRPPESWIFFFGSTQFRHVIKSDAVFGESYLCYSPEEAEGRKCVEILAGRYPGLVKLPREKIESLAHLAVEYYSGDLAQCDMHLERMEKSGGDFDAAILGQTEANSFQVVDAVAAGNPALIELRMQQCFMSGENVGAILKAIASFLRQLARVQAAYERNRNLDAVFRDLEIRVPLQQARLRKALGVLPPERIAAFFFHAPALEMELRTHRRPHDWLASELTGLAGFARPGAHEKGGPRGTP